MLGKVKGSKGNEFPSYVLFNSIFPKFYFNVTSIYKIANEMVFFFMLFESQPVLHIPFRITASHNKTATNFESHWE